MNIFNYIDTVHLLSWTEELAKAGTCAHDRRALQQLDLNVHVKHSDLTVHQHMYKDGRRYFIYGYMASDIW